MSRALLAVGALLACATLAQAEERATFSPDLVDPPVAAAPRSAPEPAAAAPAPAARDRVSRRRSRSARARERSIARAAAELSRRVDPTAGIRHLTIGSIPAPMPPDHDAVSDAVATLETPPPAGNREVAAPTPQDADATSAREAASHGLAEMLARHAFEEGVPVALAKAVVRIESGGNARATNHGALGLMQIKWATAHAVGFSGPAVGLLVADTNLRFGMKVLAQAYRDARGDLCGALMRYQSGHLARHPSAANRAYCARARSLMARG